MHPPHIRVHQKITPLHPKNCWHQNESLSGAKDLAFNKGQDCRKSAVEQGFCWFLGRLRLSYEVADSLAKAVPLSYGAWKLATGVWSRVCVD